MISNKDQLNSLNKFLSLEDCTGFNIEDFEQVPDTFGYGGLTKSNKGDPELLIIASFETPVILSSIMIESFQEEFAPDIIKIYCNNSVLDFSDVESIKPVEAISLNNSNLSKTISLKPAKFRNITSLTLYFSNEKSNQIHLNNIQFYGLEGQKTNFSDLKKSEAEKILEKTKSDCEPVQIVQNLFIGSVGASANIHALLGNKITHIIVCGTSLKKHFPDDFTYLKFNLRDIPEENIKQYFMAAYEFINKSVNSGGSVLIHCRAGISRSATILLSYLMRQNNMTYRQALSHCRSLRSKIRPNEGFAQQLQEYEDELKDSN
jgi:hypothetical protein